MIEPVEIPAPAQGIPVVTALRISRGLDKLDQPRAPTRGILVVTALRISGGLDKLDQRRAPTQGIPTVTALRISRGLDKLDQRRAPTQGIPTVTALRISRGLDRLDQRRAPTQGIPTVTALRISRGLDKLDQRRAPARGGDHGRLGRVRAVIQRVLRAGVSVEGQVVGAFDEPGLLVYLGVTHTDGPDEVAWMARKIWELRLLREERSASDVGAPVLVISQFTLYGDARKGRRPTWLAAAPGPVSEPAYDAVCAELERLGARVERGVFGADMRVESVNDGPVTLILEKEAPQGT